MFDIATYNMIKNIKYFHMCGGQNSCRKVKYYEAHIFPRPLLRTCRLETTFLCLNSRLRVNKNFSNSHYFYEININVCLLCSRPVMTSIILIFEDLTVNKNSVTLLVFMFKLILFYRILSS